MGFQLDYTSSFFARMYDQNTTDHASTQDHFHMLYEVIYFVSGEGDIVVENKKYKFKAGDILLVLPGQHHFVKPTTFPFDRYAVKLQEIDIPPLILSKLRSRVGCYAVENIRIASMFNRLDEHVENYSSTDLEGLLKCTAKEILYYFCKESNSTESVANNENMIELLDFINQNLTNQISLNEMSKQFHYSKSYISKEFQNCMNVSIMHYVRTRKVLLADEMIKSGKKPVDACIACGFSDYSTFFRAYKKVIGHPPSLTHLLISNTKNKKG